MNPEILQLGAVAVIFLFAIREFFLYLKNRKNINGTNKDILKELQLMNTNHLNSICKTIENVNKDLTGVIHQDNIRIIELLGEIKGNLNK